MIVHNDQFNPMLTMIEEFEEEMRKFNPKLFVLGGLQMMDNFPFPPGRLRHNKPFFPAVCAFYMYITAMYFPPIFVFLY